ncbi:MAG: phosphodiester glycosidase family protein [Actinomycetota bacterium]|nr:phosphodiester glycosidase family protein [Actinomycetota bacterium]
MASHRRGPRRSTITIAAAMTLMAGPGLMATGCSSGASGRSGLGDGKQAKSAPPSDPAPDPATNTRRPDRPLPEPPTVDAGWVGAPGDGQWSGAGRSVGTTTAVRTTTLRMGGHVVSAAWVSAAKTTVALYAGTSQPAGPWSNDGAVPPALQASLVAAFNGGFQLDASRGGWYADGHQALSLRDGAASLVIRANGSATVAQWGRDATLTPDVIAVRQNLELLVDGGAPTPLTAATNPITVWGDPLHENVLTWRSALGVDASGDLVYVAGPGLDPPTLAAAMVAVGAVRAMQLDINPKWVSFDTFTGDAAPVSGTKLLESMYFPTNHFLTPYWRDFVAVFAR